MPPRTVAIVDGNSLIHRAFHALPTSMTAPDGRPTGAAFGFMQMLLKMIEVLCPDVVIVAWDHGRPAFRSAVLEQYKVHRPPTARELSVQFPMVRAILEAMRIPQVDAEGWEADDLLGTLAAQAEQADRRVLLVTGDRDALQLVDDRVSVVSTRRGLTDIAVYDAGGVREKLGVDPAQVPDYLGLKGDVSDNIPGVPGVGEKTAAKLIQEYGSLEAVLDAADAIKGKLGENLREHAGAARASKTVAAIRRDAPIQVDLEHAGFGPVDEKALLALFTELQFTSLMNKVFTAARSISSKAEIVALDASPASESAPAPEAAPWHTSLGPGAADVVARWLDEDTDAWVGVAMAAEGSDSLLPSDELGVARDGVAAVVEADRLEDVLRDVLVRGRVSAGDVKALLQRLCPPGSCPNQGDGLDSADSSRMFDCAIAGYLLESGRSAYDLDGLYAEYLGRRLIRPEPGGAAAAGARAATELRPRLRELLEEDGSLTCFETIEMPLVPVLARMERVGVGVDIDVLAELGAEVNDQATLLMHEIQELAGTEFNIDSPRQLAEVLFVTLGLPSGKRTKSGFSTDSSVLSGLAESYPIAAKVLTYRELTKLRGTYIDALPKLIGADGRLHTTFNQTVAATGRLSSSNPNLQNIPVRSDLGRRIRAAFVPARAGDVMVSADYSQAELRILAHLSGDPGLIEAFTSGRDFHATTASRVFGVPVDDVDAEQRRRAKAVNFGIVYGQTPHGRSESLGVTRAEASAMIERYFAAYPRVRQFLDETVARAHRDGSATTMFGRRRRIPELNSSNFSLRSFGERTAMNHPMQGTAADIMKLAMIEVDRRLRAEGFESRMVLQVHDELVFESPASEVERLSAMAAGVMSTVAQLAVPLDVSVAWGANWAAAK